MLRMRFYWFACNLAFGVRHTHNYLSIIRVLQVFENSMATTQLPIHSDPEIMGGTPVFVGTRVPAQILLDYLEGGDSIDEFLDSFPSVTREQAVVALELGNSLLVAKATTK